MERARYFNPRMLSGMAMDVVVKSYRPGAVRDAEVLKVLEEASRLSLLRHRSDTRAAASARAMAVESA